MKAKKFFALLLAVLMVLGLAACGGNDSGTPADTGADAGGDTPADTGSTDGGSYTVGICQLMEHDALDAATKGFQDALTDKLGDSVTYEYHLLDHYQRLCFKRR